MLANSKMIALMQEVEESHKVEVPQKETLSRLLRPEFVELNGCIVIGDQLAKNHAKKDDFEDETGFEVFVNHIHLDGTELGEGLNPINVLGLSLKIVELWQSKLARDFPNEKFLIILGFDEGETTLRFYKVRQSETPWINLEALEKYEEAVLVAEVG